MSAVGKYGEMLRTAYVGEIRGRFLIPEPHIMITGALDVMSGAEMWLDFTMKIV